MSRYGPSLEYEGIFDRQKAGGNTYLYECVSYRDDADLAGNYQGGLDTHRCDRHRNSCEYKSAVNAAEMANRHGNAALDTDFKHKTKNGRYVHPFPLFFPAR
ncbi:MAG: hypothetical protein WD492_02525 [Alkalispirochaeta sp.]